MALIKIDKKDFFQICSSRQVLDKSIKIKRLFMALREIEKKDFHLKDHNFLDAHYWGGGGEGGSGNRQILDESIQNRPRKTPTQS
jgi:hypothetical protein